ncbi:1467_t:CDS:1, partial [Cetraspora pellucida]
MPLLLISGIDVMGITFLIASGLLTNETIPSYCWIFRQLKELIGDTTFYSIQTLLTDREHALISAVRTEAPHIKHQLCIWHVEQNIIKNLNNKLKERFISFIKDFKVIMFEAIEKQFEVLWDRLLAEYPEANSYMTDQWKPLAQMWACCYTNKNVNYGIRTTQRSEASNAHLKRLLGHTVPLPELINALEKLTCYQLQRSQYQQYRLRGSIRQQCPELLKDISIVVSDFVYSLILEQYNKATSYNVERQDANLFHVYHDEDRKYNVYQTDTGYICCCDYSTQFSLPCRHILSVHIVNKKVMSVGYIGARWIVSPAGFDIDMSQSEENNFTEFTAGSSPTNFSNEPSNDFLATIDHSTHNMSVEQTSTRSTAELLKDIEAIADRVGHIKINNILASFVERLNTEYPLLQEDIKDPVLVKTKGRPNSTKRKKTGAEHATKKMYICSICSSAGHNSRSCPR